jgi:hypothetical protein
VFLIKSNGRVEVKEKSTLLMKRWERGDSIGCVVDVSSRMVLFTCNGRPIGESIGFPESKRGFLEDKDDYCVGISGGGGYARVLVNMGE